MSEEYNERAGQKAAAAGAGQLRMPANDGAPKAQLQLQLQLAAMPGQAFDSQRSSPSHNQTVDEPGIDPRELETRAVEVAALAAGISRTVALQALDASATLIRRAMALRLMTALGKLRPNDHGGRASRPCRHHRPGRRSRRLDLSRSGIELFVADRRDPGIDLGLFVGRRLS